MIVESLDAWVLNRSWIGDTSAMVTLYTREQGLVKASYKGGRTPKKQANLQVFTPLWVALNKRHDWYYVQQIEIKASSLPLSGHHLFSGLYINELLHHALKPCDPSPYLYDIYEETLRELSSTPTKLLLEACLRRFELQLLMSCGYEVSYHIDAQGAPVKADQEYRFIAGEGFIRAATLGIPGEHLLAIAHNQLHNADVLKAAKRIMRAAINYALDGKAIKTRDLFRA
jgi:DNA repair protein RecO (recombination protein O)